MREQSPSGPSAFDVTIMADPAARALGRQCPKCGGWFPADYAVCPRDATPLGQVGAEAGADPLLGAILGGSYRLSRVLGEGGMARLYEAEHLSLDRRYAVKVIHEHLARRPELLARFEREARAASRIRSEHVVQVLDLQRTADGRPCIVAELLDGHDLQVTLERGGPMSAAQAIPIVRQICRALAAAHAVGVVHRDLKPSNVFLARDPSGALTAKILDFGVAKLTGDRELTSTGAVVGTPAYMAPEQAQQAAEAGPLADIYAAGAVLYRMMTGQLPYGSSTATNPLVRLLHEEPARPREVAPSIPPGVEAVIQRAMARDPRTRPQSADELEAELAAFDVAPSPMTGAPIGPIAVGGTMAAASSAVAEEIVKWARTARPLAIALVAVVFVTAALYFAALLGAAVAVLRPSGAFSVTERWLVAAFAVAGSAALVVALVRSFRRRWPSTPAVRQLDGLAGGSLLAGVVALGGLELVVRGAGFFRPSLAASPRLSAGVLLLAGAVAGVELWRRGRD
jgi:eukaryotic-like serine/threonine-protein kinase